MSSQTQTDQRNRYRPIGHPSRQTWRPKGSTATTAMNQQPRFNSNSNEDCVVNQQSRLDSYSNGDSVVNQHSRLNPNTDSFVNQQPRFNSNPNGDSQHSNYNHGPSYNGYRGQFTSKNNMGQPSNPRRGREREKKKSENQEGEKSENQEGKVLKKSTLPQLVQEIQEKLIKGDVECLICYDMVRRSAPIWSCSSCYSIFHLNCIKKWARAPTSVDLSIEKSMGSNWRCPGCQSVKLTTSKEIQYVCFCGKMKDPPSDLYLTPHSCGEPCGKPLEREASGTDQNEDLCPHLCVLQCHPGPCPPCKAFAPPQPCPCGKKIITTRCSDKKNLLTCGQHCDKLLDCWRHRCEQICHVGTCESCQVQMNASCFCKKNAEVLLCGDMSVKGEVSAEDGVYTCNFTCGKKLNCGNHMCNEICHPGLCGECDLAPSKVKSCCCGKTSLTEERQSCVDPIPTCEKTCGKLLPCNIHRCNQVCHLGDCAHCQMLVTQKCSCGSTSRTVKCHKTTKVKFLCERPCGRKKNCGRHRCNEKCCALSTQPGEWDPHFCSIVCGKKLRCGQHSCESLCHSGHCPPCLETIFNDLTCACGNTSIPPPQPCGTPPPTCHLPCSVPRLCGHPSSHNCHFGDCPPCSFSVAKECVGGHVVLRNIPCGSKDIRCNKLCGKTRQCGMHSCGKTCHPTPCDSNSLCGSDSGMKASCGQTCGAPRRDCKHTCSSPCHPSAYCPDLRCDFPVIITCTCGRISAKVPCDAGGNSCGDFNADTVYETSLISKLPVPLQPVEANGKKIPLGQRKLTCDDECLKWERKRVLADAFDINPPNLDALHFGENTSAISEALSDLFRHDPKWVLSVEERCKYLVLCKNKGSTSSSLRAHVFSHMTKEKIDAVRFIADRWKLVINAFGWEPKRFLVVHVTSKSKAPSRVLGTKGSTSLNILNPPAFDSLIDMDPRLVVSLFDLPNEADISALVLRFGGECQLVWLNDKNALAVFSDPARAATAMRRLDNGSVYHGATMAVQNGSSLSMVWGGVASRSTTNPWKKSVSEQENSQGDEDWSNGYVDMQASSWRDKEAPIAATINRWNILDPDQNSTSMPTIIEKSGKESERASAPALESNVSVSSSELLDDWEKACE